MHKKIGIIRFFAGLFVAAVLLTAVFSNAYAYDFGGGYAASGQIPNVSYTSEIYDATNGLPTSDANFILGSREGYIYIGGYSGIIKYDGTTFERLDTSGGLTSGRGLFEDSKGRIWVGTNDNGVVVIDGDETIHLTYENGLPSSSIRVFTEDKFGDVYISTTAGVCYADENLDIHVINDSRINEERVLKLDTDLAGRVYGQTYTGIIFSIYDHKVSDVYRSEDLGSEKITTILVDPLRSGKLYFGTEGSAIYYGSFGDPFSKMEKIDISPVKNTHWLSYDCGRIWISSTTALGYIDTTDKFHLVSGLPMDSAIEMTTSDYQGNLWVASSTQGVMKVVTNNFVNMTWNAGLPDMVTNTACVYGDDLYVGTDQGLYVINRFGEVVENNLTEFIGDSRIRCIKNDEAGNLWVATFTNDVGLVCLTRGGEIKSFTEKNGMPSNQTRCIALGDRGLVLVGTNGGLAIFKDGTLVSTFTQSSGIKNTVLLTVCETDDEEILAGTDGDGIYVFKRNREIRRIGREDGLTSDVIMRIAKDDYRGVYWIVTSNSIQYLEDGVVHQVTSFPYNNNYDLYFDDSEYMWIVSSYGLYKVKAEEMLYDRVSDYRLYTIANGLPGTPTSNSYGTSDNFGNLYIPGRTGICRVNINTFSEELIPVIVSLSSVYVDDVRIFPDENGVYNLPTSDGRIRITPSVMDYSLQNPLVKVFLDEREEDGIVVPFSNLSDLEYTGLKYGDYKLHIQVYDSNGQTLISDSSYHLVKKGQITERPVFKIILIIIVALISGFIAWQIIKGTVIRKQYSEIKHAKDEAERANSAKTRFLANISHEIRTPINTIMGMNEMTLREDATGVPKPYFLSMMNYAFDIKNASESLLSLINDLLDMSKIESGKMHLVELEYDTQELFRSIVSMVRSRSVEKELSFDVVIDEVLPAKLYGDAGKIKQILINLLTNAVKYTESGGFALLVSMEERKDDDCLIRFSVKDTGIGVREEDMDKLFTAYERLDEEKNSGIQGTGLGLDISRRFAELMGGSLVCESEYGKGSEFILKLHQKIIDKTPVGVFMEHDQSKAKGPYVPKFIAPAADILVVDDSPMNLNVIKGLLRPTKVYVSTASSGEECLELIKDTKYNVVLLDHMMPGMDGVETVERIRETMPDLPVYALTANAAVDEAYYISKGFTGYLSKPVDSESLEKTIMKHIPEEMMEKPEENAVYEELTEIPENLSWINDVEGINVSSGIDNSGGVMNYIFSLNLFLDTIDANAGVIRDSYRSGNIRLFTIKVHALKSSARIIGAGKLSEMAAELEDAGNREDKAFIEDKAEKLLYEYEKYKEILSRLHEEERSDNKEVISDEELKEAFTALFDVIPQMDYDSVETIIDNLNEYSLPSDKDEQIKELTKLLRNFDWDGMESWMEKVRSEIGGK